MMLKNIKGLCIIGFMMLLSTVVAASAEPNTENTLNTAAGFVTEFPVEAAMMNIFTQPRIERMSTVVAGDSKPMHFFTKTTRGKDTLFEGLHLHNATMQQHISSELAAPFEFTTQHYFTLDPFKIYGFTADDGAYIISTDTNMLPKMARPNASSYWSLDETYESSDKKQLLYKIKKYWTLTRIDNKTAWLCINHFEEPLLSSNEKPFYYCYSIDGQGNLLGYQFGSIYLEGDEIKLTEYNPNDVIYHKIQYLKESKTKR